MENKMVVRDSNMELYRIVAMLLVMLFHVFGEVDQMGNQLFPDSLEPYHVINLLLTSATFVCVDMFVLLSGWYGINTRWSKVKAFIFQVLFYSVSIYLIMLLCCPGIQFSWNFLIHVFILDDYWFVPVYLMLYLFAPAINPFIKKSSNKEFLTLLLSVFIMQCIYGWLNYRESGYMEGCSPISFLILYLLGAYLRRIESATSTESSNISLIKNLSKKQLFLCYSSLITFNWIIAVIAKHFHHELLLQIAWQFSSPIIIIAAACLLLLFSKINIGYNKTINWIAASSFAAFLIHCFPLFYEEVYSKTVVSIASSLPYAAALPLLLLLVLVFYAVSILIDQARIYIYRKISSTPASAQ